MVDFVTCCDVFGFDWLSVGFTEVGCFIVWLAVLLVG